MAHLQRTGSVQTTVGGGLPPPPPCSGPDFIMGQNEIHPTLALVQSRSECLNCFAVLTRTLPHCPPNSNSCAMETGGIFPATYDTQSPPPPAVLMVSCPRPLVDAHRSGNATWSAIMLHRKSCRIPLHSMALLFLFCGPQLGSFLVPGSFSFHMLTWKTWESFHKTMETRIGRQLFTPTHHVTIYADYHKALACP